MNEFYMESPGRESLKSCSNGRSCHLGDQYRHQLRSHRSHLFRTNSEDSTEPLTSPTDVNYKMLSSTTANAGRKKRSPAPNSSSISFGIFFNRAEDSSSSGRLGPQEAEIK